MSSGKTAIKSVQLPGKEDARFEGAFSKTMSHFDHEWYGVAEAALDPYVAMLLRGTRECLENAGFDTFPMNSIPGNWGVFAALPAEASSAAYHVARIFNLTGQTMVVSTASASLLALNQACLHLKMKKCKVAIVCGARAILDPCSVTEKPSYSFGSEKEEHIYAHGEGCGVLLLMSVRDAQQYNRRRLAVIRSVSSNSAGVYCPSDLHTKIAFLCGAMKRALSEAKVASSDVSYIEADMSCLESKPPKDISDTKDSDTIAKEAGGTQLNEECDVVSIETETAAKEAQENEEDNFETDTIKADTSSTEGKVLQFRESCCTELDSIQQAFRRASPNTVVVGSAKPCIGDLGVASGIAGLIKTVMVLERAQAPGTSSEIPTPAPEEAVPNVSVFPAETADLCGVKQGRLMSAVVNSFGDAGTSEIAVLRQHSLLPHMAGVTACLVLGAEHLIGDKSWLVHEAEKTSSYYRGVFESLKNEFPIVSSALKFFNQIFEGTCNKYCFTAKEKTAAGFNVTILKLYYSVMTQLFTLDVKLSAIKSTNAMNEIAALLFAGSMGLVATILFMSCKVGDTRKTGNPVAPPTLAKMMKPPKIPVYSCVQGRVLSEETFTQEELLEDYISDLIANIWKANDPSALQNGGGSTPHLHIVSGEPTPSSSSSEEAGVFTIPLKALQGANIVRHLREKCLRLRRYSDKIRIDRMYKPEDDKTHTLPQFYEKYPFRKAMEGRETLSETATGMSQQSECSTHSSSPLPEEG